MTFLTVSFPVTKKNSCKEGAPVNRMITRKVLHTGTAVLIMTIVVLMTVLCLPQNLKRHFTGQNVKQSHHTPREATSSTKTARFEDESQHHTEKLQRARESKRAYKTRVREEAREALAEERKASESWRPERAVEIKPEQGLQMDARWKCEQYCRARTAFLSIQKGVHIHQTAETVSLTCRETYCKAKIRFLRDPSM